MAQENPGIDTIAEQKAALITDLNPSYNGKDQYTHARNAVKNSKDGDIGTIGNEQSNELCISAPYKIIGTISLPDDRILIFSTDETVSEIGIGDPRDCSYTKLSNLSCLNFSSNYPITGIAKNSFHNHIVVTFTDKNNPVRRISLKDPSKWTCDNTLLFKKISQPCISLSKGQNGTVPNGTYSAVIAYSVNNQIFTDYFSLTERLVVHSEMSMNSIEISFDGLDKQFDKFDLIIVGSFIDPETKGATKLAKNVGTFSTKVKSVTLTDFINSSYQEVPLSSLVVKKKSWSKAGLISSNSNYLILGDLVGREEIDYQLKAMSIKTEYVIEQVPASYYENGLDIGYYGDENYDFYIQGVYNTGELTDKFHIPGRISTSRDMEIVSSSDVYEHDKQVSSCTTDKVYRWQVENTASEMIPLNEEFKCDRRVLGYGKMGYYESTELYPDNKHMFGEWANTPIRYHKFPDEEKVRRYSIVDGKSYINIKGVRFKDIPAFPSPDIIGYKITRSDRKGGNGTVIARGLMTNMRSYTDQRTNQTILYNNYPVNDLSPDVYLSSTQTQYRNGSELSFTPLTDYHKDQFSFYSPHTLFEPRYTLGTEIKIESEEVAEVTGSFEKVYKHPRQKLLNQFSFWLAAAIGVSETIFEMEGLKNKTTSTSSMQGKAGLNITAVGTAAFETVPLSSNIEFGKSLTNPTGGVSSEGITTGGGSLLSTLGESTTDSLKELSKLIFLGNFSQISTYLKTLKAVLKLVANAGISAGLFLVTAMRYATDVLATIYNFTGFTDYVYQYNAHANFISSIPVKSGNKRRMLIKPASYIPSDIVTVDDKVYNNYFRERSVWLKLNKEISEPTIKDTSRGTISTFGICDNISSKVTSIGSAFYATSKMPNPNQYGELGSALPVVMHSCVLTGEESPILYGGDCIITKFQFQKRMQFFNQNIANSNYPDGTEYDYRLYRNIAYPRFWIDSTKYDFSNLLNKTVINYTTFSSTTSSKHNLDCKKKDKSSVTRIDDAYMYLSNNCVMDFFVESDFNPTFRDKTEYPFYSKTSTNLSEIFRSDRLGFEEEFSINRVYSDLYATEVYAQQQRDTFDPNDPIPYKQPNSVIYSLPSFNLQEIDNWQYFLPNNFFSFKESDFGELTSIQKLDQDRLMFLFSKSSPYISMGRDFLQLEQSGRKITVGDGGLFAQDPREIMPTDNNYGASNSRYAFSNTHLGRYYISEKQGRILQFTENIDDIARQGMSYWCKNYMPIFLYKYFPTYPKVENPVNGVGYLSVFDSFNETIYITKRDFSPKKEYINDITWDNGFFYKGIGISLQSDYFNDISWTLSYSPIDKAFISWHDWHPNLTIQTDNHFMTVKDNTIWKHNERTDSFCNFYGKDYPFEIEFVSSSGQQVETIRSLEYILEVYKYKNFGRDRFHVLNENYDRLIVSNTEQISPLLNLIHASANPETNLSFPRKSTNLSYDILFFKEQNKYRLNQFWDTVKDRGEYSNAEFHLFPTDESGYKNTINPLSIDIDKPEEERKKFRHYWNKFRLIKTVSGANKFITKLFNIKKQS